MRNRTLPLVLFTAACAAADAPQPSFIENFVDRSKAVTCEPLPGLSAREATVGDVATLGASSFLVLYPQEREVAVYDAELAPRHVVRFTAEGPTGVRGPISAALAGDTLLYVADRLRRAIRLFDLAGRDRGTISLDFSPQRIRVTPGGVLISPFVLAGQPRRLVYRLAGDGAEPLDVPTANIGDPIIGALANAAGITAYPDGRVIVTHEMVVPFAYRVDAASDSVRRIPLPVPDGIRGALDHLPPPPLTDERIRELPVTALAAAPDIRTGDFLYLTRSGRRLEDRMEKAVVRLDGTLRYRRSYLLDVNAIRLAYLATQGVSIVADEVDQWYRCPTP